MSNKKVTIIFPFRDRDGKRVNSSLLSLKEQTIKDFEVIFVDYGSQEHYAKAIKEIVDAYDFATYHYVGHKGLLWNKSKALNFGIRKAESDYVITADVDILFKVNFIETVLEHAQPQSFSLFSIGYLSQQETQKQQLQLNLNSVKVSFEGETFGIGLFSKADLTNIRGLDEFFHFYGSEDEDLNLRLTLSGVKNNSIKDVLLYHQWHPRYPKKKDNQLTMLPRLNNILRLNQRHYLLHKEQQTTTVNTDNWGICYTEEDALLLNNPQVIRQIPNIKSHVDHFFGEELNGYKNKIVSVVITEDPYYESLKYQLKKLLGKQSQPFMTMKAVNDLILQKILYHYYNYNYAYSISEDLKRIHFTIQLKPTND
jgi:glycosyltransferase involved in cell wall biosynthesis